ncbi:MAG TPA: hypothetical protein VJZ91_02505, partial [Blastocatellia bacterium]|nr:hypothetical protein [Blastocatellia bacterium]
MKPSTHSAIVALLIAFLPSSSLHAGAAQHRRPKAKPAAAVEKTIADPQRDILRVSGVVSRLMSEGDVPG